jgi:hypothetical protein
MRVARLSSFAVVVAAFSVACLSPSTERPVRDLVIVAGQSNAVGFDTDPQRLPADESDKSVMFWWRTGDPPPDEHDSNSGGTWQSLGPQPLGDALKPTWSLRQFGNFRSPRGGFGPEIGFARELAKLESRPLAIVKTAWNGTGMQSDWKAREGPCYLGLVEEVRRARAAAAAGGIDLRPRALLWIQGEADATPAGLPTYEVSLHSMFEALRVDLEAPRLALVLGVNERYGDPSRIGARMKRLMAAQQSVAAKLPPAVFVDTDGASLQNAAHFDTAGTLEVGKRFARALVELERAH